MERGPLRPLSRMTATRAPLPRPRSRSSRMVSPSVARTGRLVSMPARRTHTHTPHHTRERLLGGRAAPPCLQREGWLGDPRSLLPLRSCTPHNSALSYMHGVRSFLCVSFAARCMLSVVFIFRGGHRQTPVRYNARDRAARARVQTMCAQPNLTGASVYKTTRAYATRSACVSACMLYRWRRAHTAHALRSRLSPLRCP